MARCKLIMMEFICEPKADAVNLVLIMHGSTLVRSMSAKLCSHMCQLIDHSSLEMLTVCQVYCTRVLFFSVFQSLQFLFISNAPDNWFDYF